MPPIIASLVFICGILCLFWLDRDGTTRTSKALWIPVAWLLIAASRPVSSWLQMAPLQAASDEYLEGSPLDRFVFTVLLAVGLIVLFSRGARVATLLRANWPILLFFVYCAISTLWSDYPDVAFKRWVKALSDLVMIMIVLTDADPFAAIKRFLKRAGFVLIPASVLLIKYYPDLGREYSPWIWTPVYSGVTTGKNLLGMICLIFGLASVWRLLQALPRRQGSRRAGSLIAHGAIIVSVLWLFSKANSVTSMSCFFLVAALLVMTGFSIRGRKPAVVHLLVGAILSVSIFVLFLDPGGGFVEQLGRSPTLTGRTNVWHLVLTLTGSPLFGTGFESFWLGQRLERVRRVYTGLQEAHNGYIEVYLNLGWIGIALLSLVLVTGYRNVLAAFRRNANAGRLSLAYFVVAVVYSFTEAGFRMLAPTWIVFLLAITGLPRRIVSESPATFAIDQNNDFAEPGSEVDHVLTRGQGWGTI